MRSLSEHMAFYGSYHRDARNRLTHFFGVPILIFAILVLASDFRGSERVPRTVSAGV